MELEMSVRQSQDRYGNPDASNGKTFHVNWKRDYVNLTYKGDI